MNRSSGTSFEMDLNKVIDLALVYLKRVKRFFFFYKNKLTLIKLSVMNYTNLCL